MALVLVLADLEEAFDPCDRRVYCFRRGCWTGFSILVMVLEHACPVA